jgi:hypothetical protein
LFYVVRIYSGADLQRCGFTVVRIYSGADLQWCGLAGTPPLSAFASMHIDNLQQGTARAHTHACMHAVW